MAVSISEVHEVDLDLVAAFAKLVPQLSSSSPPPTADELAEVVATPGTTVFVARSDDGIIVGTLTLVTYRIPTGMRAHIDDVVVDEAARGQRASEALARAALDKAAAVGCKSVDLTSRPSREAANHIYRSMGFEQRETNVYRYDLASPA